MASRTLRTLGEIGPLENFVANILQKSRALLHCPTSQVSNPEQSIQVQILDPKLSKAKLCVRLKKLFVKTGKAFFFLFRNLCKKFGYRTLDRFIKINVPFRV
ncbi:unnamed protein product [Ixodes pacificus]